MSEINQEQLNEWKQLTESATKGWILDLIQGVIYIPAPTFAEQVIVVDYSGQHRTDDMIADLEFIALSRTAIPSLITEVERLTAENSRLQKELNAAIQVESGSRKFFEGVDTNSLYEV